MPLAKEIAAELRKVADALDRNPDVETIRPYLNWFHSFSESKEKFLAAARLLPHPLEKIYEESGSYPRVKVRHATDALVSEVSIYKESICTIVEPARPAVYDCALTLTADEDAALTEA